MDLRDQRSLSVGILAAAEGDYRVEILAFHGLGEPQSATWSSERWHAWLGQTVDRHVPNTYEITTTWLKHGKEYNIAELKQFDKAAPEKDPTSDWIPPKAGKKIVKLSAAIICPLNILVLLLKIEVVDVPTAQRILRAWSMELQYTETLSPLWKQLLEWGVECSSTYPELQRNPSPIRMRQRARKRRVELLKRILTEDRGKNTSTSAPNPNMNKVYVRNPESSSCGDEIKCSSLCRNLPIVQGPKSLVTEKDTVNYIFRHRQNYSLRLLYSDGTNIPAVWT